MAKNEIFGNNFVSG